LGSLLENFLRRPKKIRKYDSDIEVMRIGDGAVEGLRPIACCGIKAVEPSGAVTKVPFVWQSPLSLCLMKL